MMKLATSSSRSPGFTLIEMVTSLAISSILLVAIGGAMVLAGRALPSADGPAAATLSTANVVDKMTAELQYAIDITERTSHAITFTIPDRDADGRPEIVRYAWSGVAGAPVTRQFNLGTVTNLIDSVQFIRFNYASQNVIETYPGPIVEGAEVLLASHFPGTGTYTSSEHYLNPFSGCGQFFKPALPADAYSYRVTRVVLRARKNNPLVATGTIGVSLFKANASKLPTGSALAMTTLLELLLPAGMGNVDVPLNAGGIAPTDDLCFTIENALNLLTAGRVEYCAGSGSGMLTASSGNYAYNSSNSLRYQVYGKVSTITKRTLTRTVTTHIDLSMQATTNGASRVDSAIALPNQPESLAAQWMTQFDQNPTTADLNVDGASDWRSGTGFDTGTISGGVWRADRTIDSNPLNSFTQFTTVDVVMRDTTTTGSGAGIEMRVEATLLGHGIIEAYVSKKSDNTQTLTLQTRDLLLLPAPLLIVQRLPVDMVKLRLYIDPSDDSVGVVINDVFYGSYKYNRSVDLADGVIRAFNTLGESGAEFDSIKVRVSN